MRVVGQRLSQRLEEEIWSSLLNFFKLVKACGFFFTFDALRMETLDYSSGLSDLYWLHLSIWCRYGPIDI